MAGCTAQRSDFVWLYLLRGFALRLHAQKLPIRVERLEPIDHHGLPTFGLKRKGDLSTIPAISQLLEIVPIALDRPDIVGVLHSGDGK